MRSERLYLTDIVEAVDTIERFLDGVDADNFIEDELVQSAVLQKLSVIGEAAARLPRPFREQHSHVPWRQIADFRNFVVHAYFAVNWSIVWVTATQDAPVLREQVERILGGFTSGAGE
jgi:uncharacterized protein with HEPN domain